MVGNWYCVPSSCGRVVYREYLPPVVRWRYPGEAWQKIEGNNYLTQTAKGKCPGTYFLFGTYFSVNTRASGCNVVGYWRTAEAINLVNLDYSVPVTLQDDRLGFNNFDGNWYINWMSKAQYDSLNISGTATSYERIVFVQRNTCVDVSTIGAGYNFVTTHYKRSNNQPDNCGDCTFKVFKNDQIVYQETRSVCPEVEQLPCRLSDETRQIEIKKIPYLERIEVVDYAYDVRWGLLNDSNNYGLLLFKGKIPDNCLNIYENSITSIIPNDFISITNTPENGFNLIAQICSAPGCPPPEYQVICDCNCESCPEDTCPVKCGDHICCYGNDGIAVQSIPIDSYCGD